MARPNQARLDLTALQHNLQHARALTGNARTVAVVKANAYGHGALVIAKALAPHSDALAVACIEEAVTLREGGITTPLVLLQGVFEPRELELSAKMNFWVMVNTLEQIRWLEEAKVSQPINCWLKVDTGMHRLGVLPEQAQKSYQRLRQCPQVDPNVVLATHLACADDTKSPLTDQQVEEFERVCTGLEAQRSIANSAGVLAWPSTHADWIRPGYMLYGNSPMATTHPNAAQLKPVMTLVSAVTAVREVARGESVGYGADWRAPRNSIIATVTIGYGDGYPRGAPAGTPVLINGQRAPLAGRVSMDMITVDVTDLPGVAIGDEVILWGEGLPLSEVGKHAQTIGYELTTRMPARTPRVVACN